MLDKLKKYIINPEFTPVGIENKAANRFGKLVEISLKFHNRLCAWVSAIYKYATVYKVSQPKLVRVSSAESDVKHNRLALDEKRSNLAVAEEQLDQLKQTFRTR